MPANGDWELPLTGGIGTGIVYVAGVLVLAGVVLLIVRDRRGAAN